MKKSKLCFFSEARVEYLWCPRFHMHEHERTSDPPRSAPTPCFSSVVICSAAPQTKAQQNLLQEAEGRGPVMCLLCLCHLITYTHSYFSQISFYMCVFACMSVCVCVCACVHTWLLWFPFRVMLFALVITRLSHHLFVCLSACASVCVCVFVNVYACLK